MEPSLILSGQAKSEFQQHYNQAPDESDCTQMNTSSTPTKVELQRDLEDFMNETDQRIQNGEDCTGAAFTPLKISIVIGKVGNQHRITAYGKRRENYYKS